MSSDALELQGLGGRRIAWSELATVQALSAPQRRKMLVFSNGHGKAIALDSTFYGWEEFLERGPELAAVAGPKIRHAIEQLREGESERSR